MGNGIVIAPHQFLVIGVGADQGDAAVCLKRQQAVPVLQQDHGFTGHLQRQRPVLRSLDQGSVQIVPGRDAVHLAQPEAFRENAAEIAVQVGLVQDTPVDGLEDMRISLAAFHVHAVPHAQGGGYGGVIRETVAVFLIEVGKRPAVRDDQSLVTPFSAENLIDEIVVCRAGHAPEAVVGRHHFFHAGLGDQVLESGEIGLTQVALTHLGVETVAVLFRPGMDGIMLGAGMRLEHFGVRVALQAPDDGRTQYAGQVRVLAISLHAAAPAGIAEDVDVGRPEG